MRYILDPQDVYGPNFPGETFRVLKEKEIKKFGEYRTRRLVLEAWDRMQESIDNGTEYIPMVDPPPAHPSVAHPNRDGSVYEGPGLVLENEPTLEAKTKQSKPEGEKIATRDEEIISAEPKVEKTVTGVKSKQTSDYSLYKCKGCGQMVMGFDKENHVHTMHGGEELGFSKL